MIWLPEAIRDIDRLYDFLSDKNPQAARNAVLCIQAAVRQLEDFPEIGRLWPTDQVTGKYSPPSAPVPTCCATAWTPEGNPSWRPRPVLPSRRGSRPARCRTCMSRRSGAARDDRGARRGSASARWRLGEHLEVRVPRIGPSEEIQLQLGPLVRREAVIGGVDHALDAPVIGEVEQHAGFPS